VAQSSHPRFFILIKSFAQNRIASGAGGMSITDESIMETPNIA